MWSRFVLPTECVERFISLVDLAVLVDAILLLLATLLAVPTLALAVEVAASLLVRRSRGASNAPEAPERPRVGVVVPAHNEERVLAATLQSLLPQLRQDDRLLVIADNCNDATARIARSNQALCVERDDRTRRGKGYAMEAGVRFFDQDPPPVLIFNDADVIAAPGAIDAIAKEAIRTGRPIQGEYLMAAPARARSVDLVSRFAFTLKNRVRPLGLWNLGLPVPLFGSGMAFPWESIRSAPLASGDLVEDMRLGINLCRRGHAPLFCPAARFTGRLPGESDAADSQRRRWEHGHLNVLRSVPSMLASGLIRRDGRCVAMAIDHLIQPLTVLTAELLVVFVLSLAWWLSFAETLGAVAAGVAGGSLALLVLCLLVAWATHMRREIPLGALSGLPSYLVTRIGNQTGWFFHRQTDWVRTPRDEPMTDAPPAVSVATDSDGKPPAPGVPAGAPGAAIADDDVEPPTTPTANSERRNLVTARL